MTPIISPWIFYWISVLDELDICLTIFSVIGLAVGFIVMCVAATEFDSFDSEAATKKTFKMGKISFILSAIILILTMFIPSQTVCLQMLIAQNATYERIEIVGQTVEEICADIINLSTKYEENASE